MKWGHGTVFAALSLFAFTTLGQSRLDDPAAKPGTAPVVSEAGAVVENVEIHSAGERAGLQEGDVLLRWRRGDQKGEIGSPFDIFEIEAEQAPRGEVMFYGSRGSDNHAWVLGLAKWGIKVRPNLSGHFLSAYRAGQKMASANHPAVAAAYWQTIGIEEEASSDPESVRLNAWFHFRAGELLAHAKLWKKADDEYENAAREVRKVSLPFAAQVLQAWAKTFLRRQDWSNAEKYCLQSAAGFQESAGASLRLATTFNILGTIAYETGDLEKAEDYYQRALAIREQLAPGSLGMAGSYDNLGTIADDRGDLSQAEDYYLRAEALQEALAPESTDLVSILSNLGLVQVERGDLLKAQQSFRQALALVQKLHPEESDYLTAALLTNLGLVSSTRGELIQAEKYYRQAMAIERKLSPHSLSVARLLSNLGSIASQRDDFPKAQAFYRQALLLREKISPKSLEVAVSLYNLGELAELRGDPAGARRYILRALAIYQDLSPDSVRTAETLSNLAKVTMEQGRSSEAREYYLQSLAITKRLAPETAKHAAALAGLASLLRRERQFDAASKLYAEALDTLEKQMDHLGGAENARSGFYARYADYYKEYADTLLQQKQPELAFQVVERSRARTLLEILVAGHMHIHAGADAALLDRERLLRASLTNEADRRLRMLDGERREEQVTLVEKKIDQLTAQYDDTEAQIRAASPGYAALAQPQPLTAKQVQEQLLDQDTLLLEYSLGQERSYVFAVSANSVVAHELPSRMDIESSARRMYGLLSARNHTVPGETEPQRQARIERSDAQLASAAQELSNKILAPVAEQILGNEKRLVIVSDGALQYIPFAALPVPSDAAHSKRSAPLIANHEIVNLPSASVLSILRTQQVGRPQAPKAVAVLADPVFDNTDYRVKATSRPALAAGEADGREDLFADTLTRSLADLNSAANGELRLRRLPFTRKEAEAIMAVTPSGQGLMAVDFVANRGLATSQELSQYRIVHFATHGLLDSVHPELSGIVLSMVDEQGRPQSGFLGLQDIYNLNLPADLVVLSACETGLGKEIQGEGIVGLTRGFMYAGANRVVASLWNVSDVATAKFMAQFYAAMEKDGVPPAAALRAAQLHMWKQSRWSSPYYWAAFQIQGEWK